MEGGTRGEGLESHEMGGGYGWGGLLNLGDYWHRGGELRSREGRVGSRLGSGLLGTRTGGDSGMEAGTWEAAWGKVDRGLGQEPSASPGMQGETEGNRWRRVGAAPGGPSVHGSPLRVDVGVDASQGGGSSLLSPGGGKCELTGRGRRGLREQGGGQGRGLPYLDLSGVKGHNKAKEQERGNADHAFNQEQVERPLLGGREKAVRS